MSSFDNSVEDSSVGAATVPLRLESPHNAMRIVTLTVVECDDLVQEIRCDGHVIGFIHRAGRIFVALAGSRHDRALECAQSVLWEKVASTLVAVREQDLDTHKPDALPIGPSRAGDLDCEASGDSVCCWPRTRALSDVAF